MRKVYSCRILLNTMGLDYDGVLFVWQTGPRSKQEPTFGRNIPLHVAGMVGGKGGRTIYDGFAKGSRRASLVGKRRLIRGGGTAARISNTLQSPDPGGGGLSTVTRPRTPAWTLSPTGPQNRLGLLMNKHIHP